MTSASVDPERLRALEAKATAARQIGQHLGAQVTAYVQSARGTAVEKRLGEADDIPRVSAATASKVEVGARYAGPAVGIATALVDVYRAPTLEDKCVEGVAGVSGLAAGAAGGELGALAGSAGGPWGTGGGAAFGSVLIGWIGSELGEQLGDVLCR